MSVILLLLYGAINGIMILSCLVKKGDLYKFPFWVGLISIGWFFPQAVGGYFNINKYPDSSYETAMLFASMCNLAIWFGWSLSYIKPVSHKSWLASSFYESKLYYIALFMCICSFYFQWKLWNLPKELLEMSQWSGDTVKYHFFSGIFKYGFITLWVLYLSDKNRFSSKYIIVLIPCFLIILDAALLRGRRAEMMNLVAYTLVGLWLVRNMIFPRWAIIFGLIMGMVLINSIGLYRSIMTNEDLSVSEKIELAANANYLDANSDKINESGKEFENYLYQRSAIAAEGAYDYGAYHWNRFVFNYIPAQLIGSAIKYSLLIKSDDPRYLAMIRYGHYWNTGETSTGYSDAFLSFGWFGFIKFILIGFICGVLYRSGLSGNFLGQVLYILTLGTAMQTITHGTNDFLIKIWIYFFVLVYPLLKLAKSNKR